MTSSFNGVVEERGPIISAVKAPRKRSCLVGPIERVEVFGQVRSQTPSASFPSIPAISR